MLVVMKAGASPADVEQVCALIRSMGLVPHPLPGASRTAIGITGNQGPVNPVLIERQPGVEQCVPVTKAYKLVLREMKPEGTTVEVRGTRIGGGKTCTVIAGPCAVETAQQVSEVAAFLKDQGVNLLRGGAFKPRSSPYSFQGLEQQGLDILREAGDRHQIGIVTEVMDTERFEAVEAATDMLQIGARNMQNYALLRRAGKSRKPVLLKRGLAATLEDLLLSAEYLLHGGNFQTVMCERGVRTFSDHSRNTFDLAIVPVVQRISHLPIIADPSHAMGRRVHISPMAKAALACGADGLMIEVARDPDRALSDGAQTLDFHAFAALMKELRTLAAALGRTLN